MKQVVSGVYQIKNITNNDCYIGSSINIDTRWKKHKNLLKQNKHHSEILQRAWKKYGEKSFIFEIIENIKNETYLIEREQYYLDVFLPKYNVCKKAGNMLGFKHSKKTREKIKQKLTGIKRSEETKEKISFAKKGVEITEETRKKIGEAQTGNKHHRFWKDKNFSDKHKEKIKQKLTKYKRNKSSLTEQIVFEIKEKYKPWKYTRKMLAQEYNVSEATIKNIIQNRSWKEI